MEEMPAAGAFTFSSRGGSTKDVGMRLKACGPPLFATVLGCEPGNTVAGQTVDGPFFVRPGAELAIKLERRLIPIEHCPFHSAALPIARDLGQPNEKRAPIAPSPLFWPNEKVFQVKSAPTHPGRKIMKEKREADRFGTLFRKQHLGPGMRPEKIFGEQCFGCDHLVRRALVFGECMNEGKNGGN